MREEADQLRFLTGINAKFKAQQTKKQHDAPHPHHPASSRRQPPHSSRSRGTHGKDTGQRKAKGHGGGAVPPLGTARSKFSAGGGSRPAVSGRGATARTGAASSRAAPFTGRSRGGSRAPSTGRSSVTRSTAGRSSRSALVSARLSRIESQLEEERKLREATLAEIADLQRVAEELSTS